MSQQITSTFWHFEGKQFMTGHWDGSISVWNYRNPKKPEEASYPHGMCKSVEFLFFFNIPPLQIERGSIVVRAHASHTEGLRFEPDSMP